MANSTKSVKGHTNNTNKETIKRMLNDLVKLIIAENIDWKRLARRLGIYIGDIETIDTNFKTGEKKAYSALMLWFHKHDHSDNTKEMLIEAIKMESRSLAEKICELHNIKVPQQCTESSKPESTIEDRPNRLNNTPMQETRDVKKMIELFGKEKSGKEYSPPQSDISTELNGQKRVKEMRELFQQEPDDNETSERRTLPSNKQNISTRNGRNFKEVDCADNAGDSENKMRTNRSQSATTPRPNKSEDEMKRRSTFPNDPRAVPRTSSTVINIQTVQHLNNYQLGSAEEDSNKNEKEYICSKCGATEKKKAVGK